MSDPTEYVQPIVLLVDKADPAAHIDAITAVALASVRVYARDLAYEAATDVWDEWLGGPFAKSVRRADPKALAKVIATLDPDDYLLVEVGQATALAFRPMKANELPKILSRLQVSGTELPEAPGCAALTNITVVLNQSLGMTTGKAAAQAAHALFLWYLNLGERQGGSGVQCNIIIVPEAEFETLKLSSGSTAIIEDAGRTEIAPGSVTAFAFEARA